MMLLLFGRRFRVRYASPAWLAIKLSAGALLLASMAALLFVGLLL